MIFKRLFISLIFLLSGVGLSSAHTLGIDKAELSEIPGNTYQLSSYVPNNLVPYITTPELPDFCDFTTNPRGERGSYEVRFIFICDRSLSADDTIVLPWNREGVMLTVRWLGQEPVTRLSERTGSFIEIDLQQYLAGSGSFVKAAKRYTVLGIDHILAGLDHLLFILGLLLIVKGVWQLVKTITAFTLAHSITLGLATLGFVNVPSKPVEAIIALSIVFLAMEIIYGWQGRIGLAHRIPWLVAFGFGLLHGFGFAGALSEIGLPPPEIPIALLFFNVGVEIGQLFFVAVILLTLWMVRSTGIVWPVWIRYIPVYSIGTIGCYWLIVRMNSIIFI